MEVPEAIEFTSKYQRCVTGNGGMEILAAPHAQ
jgi:hypothetical protein